VFVYKSHGISLVLLFGYLYGAGRDEFSVVQIKNNNLKLVFDNKMEWPIQFADLNNDQHIQFIGEKSSSEVYEEIDSLDAQITTYDPSTVYDIENDFKVDERLTEKYNSQNYVWAGTHPPKEVKVFHPRHHGKPHIVEN
jgi:hypothetical protein